MLKFLEQRLHILSPLVSWVLLLAWSMKFKVQNSRQLKETHSAQVGPLNPSLTYCITETIYPTIAVGIDAKLYNRYDIDDLRCAENSHPCEFFATVNAVTASNHIPFLESEPS